MEEKSGKNEFPNLDELQRELGRVKYRKAFFRALRGTIFSLITVAAIAVLAATLFFPVLIIRGSSMEPTLQAGEIVVLEKGKNLSAGDVVAFYYNNEILVKRVIATSGQWVNIDSDGNVYVDEKQLDEPYLQDKAFGQCDLQLPYQVPDNRVFLMGDHRSTSVDSRSSQIGCIASDKLVGRLWVRIWPLDSIKKM